MRKTRIRMPRPRQDPSRGFGLIVLSRGDVTFRNILYRQYQLGRYLRRTIPETTKGVRHIPRCLPKGYPGCSTGHNGTNRERMRDRPHTPSSRGQTPTLPLGRGDLAPRPLGANPAIQGLLYTNNCTMQVPFSARGRMSAGRVPNQLVRLTRKTGVWIPACAGMAGWCGNGGQPQVAFPSLKRFRRRRSRRPPHRS